MRQMKIAQTASFFYLLLSPAQVICDALLVLYHRTATFQPDGDPKVATTVPDEREREVTNLIDVVYAGEGARVTFSPFAAPCCVAGMALGVGVFLWGEVRGNNLIFSSFGEEENVVLDGVFGEEMESGNVPFVFFLGRVIVSRLFSFSLGRGMNPSAFFGGKVRKLSVSLFCLVEIHFALVLFCDL